MTILLNIMALQNIKEVMSLISLNGVLTISDIIICPGKRKKDHNMLI